MTALAPKLKRAAIIEFNQEKLEAHIVAVENKYSDIVVTEDNLSDIGKDRASINKLNAEIKKAFSEVKKQTLSPISDLEQSVKDSSNRLDVVYRSIKNQEDEFERKRRETAKTDIEAIRQQILADNHVNNNYAHLVEIKDAYLNKTADQAKVLDDLTAQAKQAYKLQKADQDAAKIKEQKTKMIAEYCSMYSKKFELKKPLDSIKFNRLIDADIDTMQESIADAAHIQRQAELKQDEAKAKAETVEEKTQTKEPVKTTHEPQTASVQPIKQDESPGSLDIRIHATSQQRIALTEFMRESGIKFQLITSNKAA